MMSFSEKERDSWASPWQDSEVLSAEVVAKKLFGDSSDPKVPCNAEYFSFGQDETGDLESVFASVFLWPN